LIINTPIGKNSKYDDSYIRKAAIKYKIPYMTTASAAESVAEAIKAYLQKKKGMTVKSLQAYHRDIL
jgi:carbamoyl-phosphate synthase large subunit